MIEADHSRSLGSVAAWLQSALGPIGAGSAFAYLQSAAMGGYGAAVVNGITQACVAISGTTAAAAGWWLSKNA